MGGVSGGCGCCAVRASWPLPRRDRFSRPRCVNRHDALSMSPLVPRSRCSPGPASDARITFDDGERFAADVGLVVIGGGGHSGAAAELCHRRRQAVVGAMKHAWSSYVKHAWGHDELDPQVVAALPPPLFSAPSRASMRCKQAARVAAVHLSGMLGVWLCGLWVRQFLREDTWAAFVRGDPSHAAAPGRAGAARTASAAWAPPSWTLWTPCGSWDWRTSSGPLRTGLPPS